MLHKNSLCSLSLTILKCVKTYPLDLNFLDHLELYCNHCVGLAKHLCQWHKIQANQISQPYHWTYFHTTRYLWPFVVVLILANRKILSTKVNFFPEKNNKSRQSPKILFLWSKFCFMLSLSLFFSVSSDLNVGKLRKLLWPT